MPTISGRVVFDKNRECVIVAGDSGLANVPVVLQNTATGNRLVVLTDATGNYSIINVPNDSYRIVEAYGEDGGVPTPGDFSTAAVGPVPVGTDPPISFATNPPAGSTNLDSTSPNTLLVTVTGENLTNENFLDGPIIYTPITDILDPCVTILPNNFITAAANGTFGSNLPGTPIQTSPATEPYPGVTPDFAYTQYPIVKDGEYSILNIGGSSSLAAWWNMSDHTTGDETGRFMIINGFNPGAVFFQQIVSVTPNTNYIFTSWIANIDKVIGEVLPELGVLILDQNGDTLYSDSLGNLIPTSPTVPEWKQLGTVINSENNTQLTVKFVSQGPAAKGNDYAIDDILLQPINIPVFTPVKSVSSSIANVGETVNYIVTLTNTCARPLTNVFFQDTVPSGLSFVNGSATGGLNPVTDNPNVGFTVPDILGGGTATINFKAHVDSIPTPNPIDNVAIMSYLYTPVQGGIANLYSQNSNPAPLQVNTLADISIVKTANPSPVVAGQQAIYTMNVSNAGPSYAHAVTLTDAVPACLLNLEYSLDGGLTWIAWPESINIGTIAAGATVTVLIRGTVNPSCTGTITNTATVSSPTPDPDPQNNTSTVITPVTTLADVSVVKTASLDPVITGQTLTYTMNISNAGPSDAQNVKLADVLPAFVPGTLQYSIVSGPFIGFTNPLNLNLGTIAAGDSRTVLIQGTVSQSTTGTMTNTAVVSSTTFDPDLNNNTSKITIKVLIAKLDVVKSANKTTAALGEIIDFTIVVKNTGEVPLIGLVLSDVLPQCLQLAPNSVYINGSLISSPDIGKLPLLDMWPDAVTIVSFSAKVICAPCNLSIANSVTVSGFIVAQPPIPISQMSNTVVVNTVNPSFKQLNREEYVTIPYQKPDIEEILNTLVDIEIINTIVIKTIVGTSNEGQILTGFKLIIEGVLNEKVEYIASNAEQSVHAAHFRIPFSTFIILPTAFIEGTFIKVEAAVEDIYAKKVDRRTIFKNITFKLNAQFS